MPPLPPPPLRPRRPPHPTPSPLPHRYDPSLNVPQTSAKAGARVLSFPLPQIDPSYVAQAQAQAAALAVHYATQAGFAPAVPDPAQMASMPPGVHQEEHLDPAAAAAAAAAAAGSHPGFDPATIAAMASAAGLGHPGTAAHDPAAIESMTSWPPSDPQAAAALVAAAGPSAVHAAQMYAAAYAASPGGAGLDLGPTSDVGVEVAADADPAASLAIDPASHIPSADAHVYEDATEPAQ